MHTLHMATRHVHRPVFYSAHKNITTFTGMTSKWGAMYKIIELIDMI